MFETIGRNGRSSTFPFRESLCIFAVTINYFHCLFLSCPFWYVSNLWKKNIIFNFLVCHSIAKHSKPFEALTSLQISTIDEFINSCVLKYLLYTLSITLRRISLRFLLFITNLNLVFLSLLFFSDDMISCLQFSIF